MANKFNLYEWMRAQKPNVLLWAALFFAFGGALYFSMFSEPRLWVIWCCFIIGGVVAIVTRNKPLILLPALFIFGFGYAGTYTHLKNTPVLAHDMHGISITGRVIAISETDNKTRLEIKTNEFGTVLVSTESNQEFKSGDIISGIGGLFKPHPADIPNGFDFARHAYFSGLSASGYIKDTKPLYTSDSAAYRAPTNSFLMDALVFGDKNALSREHRTIWATNGMAHIWSISGYHISLIAGWLFIVFYFLFRLFPPLVRHIPARIPALIVSWFFLAGYVAISGAAVATLRAFIMTSLVMLAFIIGRTAISLRTIGITMFALILFNPYFVMRAGFQLSFAAIFGLVWLWQIYKPKLPKTKILKYLYGAFLTATVASVFTAPFVAAHFGSIPLYGVLGNLIFLPIFSFILMPLVMIGTIVAPFGVGAPLTFAHQIYDFIFNYATKISNLPAANINIPSVSNTSLVLIIIGLACLIFIRNIEHFKSAIARHINLALCLAFISCGICTMLFSPRPIFYISNDHKLIGAVQNGKLKFNKSRDSSNFFAFDTWKRTNGEKTDTPNEKLTKESGVHTIKGTTWKLAYIQTFVPLSKNFISLCASDEIKYIASFFDIQSKKCNEKIIRGGAVVYPSGRIKHTSFNRRWHNLPK